MGRLAMLRAHRNRLLLTGVALHALGVLGGWLWEPLLTVFLALSMIAWAYYAWVNKAIHGAVLVAAGLAANALVLLVNGAVPVSADAAVRAGVDPVAVATAGIHEPAGPDTRLAVLGKSIPVAFPPRPEVVSPGDVAVAAGLAVALSMGLTGRREPRSQEMPQEMPWPDEADGHETLEPEQEPARSATA